MDLLLGNFGRYFLTHRTTFQQVLNVKKVELIELLKDNGTNPYPNPKPLSLAVYEF